jgi:anti-sigma factor RsiW
MECATLLRLVDGYLDGRLAPRSRRRLEVHLCSCGGCRVVVDTVRRTIRLYRGSRAVAMPGPCRRRLHRLLRARWAPAPPGRASSGRAR